MSGASTWLHNQKKSELVDLAEKVGLQDYENLKKSDLEIALDQHMRANQDFLGKDRSLQAFFKRLANNGAGSPVKKEVALTETTTKTPRVARRSTREPGESVEPSTALLHSPRTSLSFASSVPLPPSPAVVASHIDRQTAKVRTSVAKAYEQSGFSDFIENTRDRVSSSTTIESLAIIVELLGLRSEVLPSHVLARVPASAYTPELRVNMPDLFAMLTADFWSVFGLWFLTSILLPVTTAYFFNPSLKWRSSGAKGAAKNSHPAAQYDPLTFHVTKALITWLVYSQGVAVGGYPHPSTVARIQSKTPGGYQGVLIGTGIGVLSSIYEAVLRK